MNIEPPFASLLDLLVKSAALILAGAALLAALRKTSAANRHAVSVTIFVALLLLPFTKLMPARWSFALEKAAAPTTNVRLPLIATAPDSVAPASAQSVENTAQPAPRPPLVIPWQKFALAVWLAGAALLLSRRALIALRLRIVVRGSFPIEDECLSEKARSLVDASGARAEVRESEMCPVPLASGFVRPVVLLPVGAAEWSDAYIFSALRHELGHIRRRDCITRLLADMLCALYWLNPLVWFAARQMRLAQEQACDDLVLNSGAPADEYAGQLVEVVRSLQGDRFTARHALAMAQPSTLETRVLAIVDPQRDRSARSVRGTFAGFAFFATMLALCTAAQLRGANERKAAPVANAPQVEIEAKFIEVTGDDPSLPDVLRDFVPQAGAQPSRVLAADKAGAIASALKAANGVDLIASPRFVTVSKQQAKIEVVREFRYAKEWERDRKSGAWKARDFDTKNVGVAFDVAPEVNADGTIEMKMTPEVVEFAGFKDLDAGTDKVSGTPDTGKPLSKRLTDGPADSGIPEGRRAQALFRTRKMSTSVNVSPGMTVVLGGMEQGGAVAGGKQPKRRLMVLVTASIVNPDAIPAEKSAKPRIHSEIRTGDADSTGKPRTFTVLSDKMTVDEKTGTVRASGNVKIETAQAVIKADSAEIAPKQEAVASKSVEAANSDAAKADTRWIFPKLDFRDATVREIVDFLVLKSQALDAGGNGANIVLRDEDKIAGTRVTLSLANVPLAEVLRYVAALASCELVRDEFAFVIRPVPQGKIPVPNADQEKAAPPAPAAPAPARPKGAAMKKADAIIFPKIDLHDATLSETVDFLRAKSQDLDPDKQGVNLILRPLPGGADPKLTLSLTNIPLSEALRYVAALAGFEIAADDHAITIRPSAK
jgi:beta-lactamase regulating signal transducer with metallopeptidase domain